MSASTLSAVSSSAPSHFYVFTWTRPKTSSNYTHEIKLYQNNSNGTQYFWQITPDLPTTRKVSAFYLARHLKWAGSLSLLLAEQSLDQRSLISTFISIYPSHKLKKTDFFEVIDGLRALHIECELDVVYDPLLSTYYSSVRGEDNDRFLQQYYDLLNNTPEIYWVNCRKQCPNHDKQLHLRAPIIPSSPKTMIDNSEAHLSDQSLVQKPALKKRKEPKRFTFEIRHVIKSDSRFGPLKDSRRDFVPQPEPTLSLILETEEQRTFLSKHQEKPC